MRCLAAVVLMGLVAGVCYGQGHDRYYRRIMSLAPIGAARIGDVRDKGTWTVEFAPEATEAQRSAVASVISTWTAQDFEGTPVERRAARYKAEADPLLLAVMGYRLELEDETNEQKRAQLQVKLDKAKADYKAAKAKIRNEIPD